MLLARKGIGLARQEAHLIGYGFNTDPRQNHILRKHDNASIALFAGERHVVGQVADADDDKVCPQDFCTGLGVGACHVLGQCWGSKGTDEHARSEKSISHSGFLPMGGKMRAHFWLKLTIIF
jgi:hypothetical protein